MRTIGIIPARYASLRFPGKPLVDIAGKPMIRHVWERASASPALDRLVIATDDERIADCARAFGAEVVMTPESCANGTERCAAALETLGDEADAVINIQGDEPLLEAGQLNQLAALLAGGQNDIATLAHELAPDERDNPNIVKVALDMDGRALAFSRDYAFISRFSDTVYRHIGLYGFRAATLLRVVRLSPTPAEKMERLEQLRWLDHGYRMAVGISTAVNYSVDVPGDLEKILKALEVSGRK